MFPDSEAYLLLSEYFAKEGLRLANDWQAAFALALRPDHTEHEFMCAAFALGRLKAFQKFSHDVLEFLSSNSD